MQLELDRYPRPPAANHCRRYPLRPAHLDVCRLGGWQPVGGDGAAGRDAGGPRLVFQLLRYPATVFDMTTASFAENAHAPILTRHALTAFLTWYAPEADFTNPTSWPIDMAPANAESHVGLPPAYIGTAGHDPLRDDGARYAELLSAAGVPVELRNEPMLVHGYIGFAGVVPAATEATDRGLTALRAALRRGAGRTPSASYSMPALPAEWERWPEVDHDTATAEVW